MTLCISGDNGPGEAGGSRLSAVVATCLGKRVIPRRGDEYSGRVTDLLALTNDSTSFDWFPHSSLPFGSLGSAISGLETGRAGDFAATSAFRTTGEISAGSSSIIVDSLSDLKCLSLEAGGLLEHGCSIRPRLSKGFVVPTAFVTVVVAEVEANFGSFSTQE